MLLNFTLSVTRSPINELAATWAGGFETSVTELNQTAGAFRSGLVNTDTLKAVFLRTRIAYKCIEFLVEYYYPSFAEEHLNGAPLLHMERHDTRPYVLPPEGMQVLDEMIFSDSVFVEKAGIANLCQKLSNETNVLMGGLRSLHIKDADAIEAMRQELVRVFTLGVTGFDTPGSLNALAESRQVMSSMKEALSLFLVKTEPEKTQRMESLFHAAFVLLGEEESFDDFDRLEFLKQVINPLYSELLDIRKNLEGERSGTSYGGLNPEGSNLFADDFLDPYFYTQLSREKDGPELRSLGKKLFFDPLLSHAGTMSCASCHDPEKAFTDGKVTSASNVVGRNLLRNAPTLLNAVYADRYFYDLRAFTLEQQAEHVVFNHEEFNTAYGEIVSKLNNSNEYRRLFKDALSSRKIKREDLSQALASYVLSLRSFNSPFDRYVRGETDTLNAGAILGFNLFMGKAACGTCHFAPTFSGLVPPRYMENESEILGVPEDPLAWKKELDNDSGRYNNRIYSEQAWIFERSFKTTTIRNVELTAPYFHNGAYATLEAVVNFYNLGGGSGFGLEVKNQTLPADPLELTLEEKEALIAFMKALTDPALSTH